MTVTTPAAPADAAAQVCPDCGGCGAVQNPYWAAWWTKHDLAARSWRASHPGGNWVDSAEYADVAEHSPAEDVEEEEVCPTCEGHGDVDRLVASLGALTDAVTNGDLSELLLVYERWRRDANAEDAEASARAAPGFEGLPIRHVGSCRHNGHGRGLWQTRRLSSRHKEIHRLMTITDHLEQARGAADAVHACAVEESPEALLADAVRHLVDAITAATASDPPR